MRFLLRLKIQLANAIIADNLSRYFFFLQVDLVIPFPLVIQLICLVRRGFSSPFPHEKSCLPFFSEIASDKTGYGGVIVFPSVPDNVPFIFKHAHVLFFF